MFANLSPRHTVALIAIATPTVYLFLLRRSVMRNVERCDAQQYGRGAQTVKPTTQAAASSPSEPPLPRSLPQSVVVDNTTGGYVLWNERAVSKPVALSELHWSSGSLDELLTRYVRATMIAFTWTPQAYLIRKMLPAGVGETFEADYINAMDFTELNKRVDGVYTVQYRGTTEPGGKRVEMRLSPPDEYTGPRSDGIIVAAIEPVGAGAPDEVVFVNETWLWRHPDEKPTLLEGSIGRWFHSLLAAWLIGKGIRSIRSEEILAKK